MTDRSEIAEKAREKTDLHFKQLDSVDAMKTLNNKLQDYVILLCCFSVLSVIIAAYFLLDKNELSQSMHVTYSLILLLALALGFLSIKCMHQTKVIVGLYKEVEILKQRNDIIGVYKS